MLKLTLHNNLESSWRRVRKFGTELVGYDHFVTQPGDNLEAHDDAVMIVDNAGFMSEVGTHTADHFGGIWFNSHLGILLGATIHQNMQLLGMGYAPNWFWCLKSDDKGDDAPYPPSEPWREEPDPTVMRVIDFPTDRFGSHIDALRLTVTPQSTHTALDLNVIIGFRKRDR